MTEKQLTELVKAIGDAMGFNEKQNGYRSNPNGNNGKRFFGFISKGSQENDTSGNENGDKGSYSDLSLVCFPEVEKETENVDSEVKSSIVCLGVGTLGFVMDMDLATSPGTRRIFLPLRDDDNRNVEEKKKRKQFQFFKNDFADISQAAVGNIEEKGGKFKINQKYRKLLQAGQYISFDPDPQYMTLDEFQNLIEAIILGYDTINNGAEQKNIKELLKQSFNKDINNLEELKKSLNDFFPKDPSGSKPSKNLPELSQLKSKIEELKSKFEELKPENEEYNVKVMPELVVEASQLSLENNMLYFIDQIKQCICTKEREYDLANQLLEHLEKKIKNYEKEKKTKEINIVNNIFRNWNLIDKNTGTSLVLVLGKWIAAYAQMRDWGTIDQKNIIKTLLPEPKVEVFTAEKIFDILKNERFIVLQGAPGTGKTWSATEVAKEFDSNYVFFEQFHAETTYSDFIWGIQPKLDGETLRYCEKKGILLRAIEQAKLLDEKDNSENKKDFDKKKAVLLIIDEINRANLSNVLGPVFYLFEKNRKKSSPFKVNIGGNELDKLPDNLYVVATMNTADRSLAVVDFALRRRFTWLTLKPHKLNDEDFNNKATKPEDKKTFREDYFNEMAEIFEKYATDEELNLQPGQSYFIVNKSDSDDAMKRRLKYELMPLIKEYLNEGYLSGAKEAFCNYFYNKIGELMYE